MTVYFIMNFNIIDQAKYEEYSTKGQSLLGPLMGSGQAKVLIYTSGDGRGVVEGVPQNHLIVLEFESREIAENWYNSDAYSSLKKLRQEATENAWAVITDKFIPQF